MPMGCFFMECSSLCLHQQFQRGFKQQWLSITFSKAIFLGNGLVAILTGLFGNVLVDSLSLGPVAPFDVAACFLAIGMTIIMTSWTENYRDPSERGFAHPVQRGCCCHCTLYSLRFSCLYIFFHLITFPESLKS
ncbi:hypothetical protein IC582_028632 [Cucumis melo]